MTEQPTPKLLSVAQTTQNRNITWQERAGMAILISMALSGVWVIAWGMGL